MKFSLIQLLFRWFFFGDSWWNVIGHLWPQSDLSGQLTLLDQTMPYDVHLNKSTLIFHIIRMGIVTFCMSLCSGDQIVRHQIGYCDSVARYKTFTFYFIVILDRLISWHLLDWSLDLRIVLWMHQFYDILAHSIRYFIKMPLKMDLTKMKVNLTIAANVTNGDSTIFYLSFRSSRNITLTQCVT